MVLGDLGTDVEGVDSLAFEPEIADAESGDFGDSQAGVGDEREQGVVPGTFYGGEEELELGVAEALDGGLHDGLPAFLGKVTSMRGMLGVKGQGCQGKSDNYFGTEIQGKAGSLSHFRGKGTKSISVGAVVCYRAGGDGSSWRAWEGKTDGSMGRLRGRKAGCVNRGRGVNDCLADRGVKMGNLYGGVREDNVGATRQERGGNLQYTQHEKLPPGLG